MKPRLGQLVSEYREVYTIYRGVTTHQRRNTGGIYPIEFWIYVYFAVLDKFRRQVIFNDFEFNFVVFGTNLH